MEWQSMQAYFSSTFHGFRQSKHKKRSTQPTHWTLHKKACCWDFIPPPYCQVGRCEASGSLGSGMVLLVACPHLVTSYAPISRPGLSLAFTPYTLHRTTTPTCCCCRDVGSTRFYFPSSSVYFLSSWQWNWWKGHDINDNLSHCHGNCQD